MITLQEGKCYRTRDGRKVFITKYRPDQKYPYEGVSNWGGVDSWPENGIYLEDGATTNLDLVAEWPDEPAPSPDPVSSPAHYTSGTIECIDAIEAMLTVDGFRGFLRGNIVKYTWRYHLKGGVDDLRKCSWYVNKLIAQLESSGGGAKAK